MGDEVDVMEGMIALFMIHLHLWAKRQPSDIPPTVCGSNVQVDPQSHPDTRETPPQLSFPLSFHSRHRHEN
jgi:hypothetical protein